MKNIYFSIILPTFNRADLIKRAIQSVVDQEFKHWELIIVDNYSNDSTEEIVKNFSKNNIIFTKFKNHGIIAKSRNYGIKLSKGKYLAFLDSDDWWYPQKLNYTHNIIQKYSSELIYHNMHIKNLNSNLIKKIKYTRKLTNPHSDLINFGPAFATSSVTVKKDLFHKIDLFNEDINYLAWEDYDAWLKFAKISNKFFYLKNTLGSNLKSKQNTSKILIKKKNILSFKNLYFQNKKISELPFWCNWSLMRLLFQQNKYKSSLKFFPALFAKSSLKNLPKIFFFYIYVLLKIQFKKFKI